MDIGTGGFFLISAACEVCRGYNFELVEGVQNIVLRRSPAGTTEPI